MWETHIDAMKAAIDEGLVEAITPLDIWNSRISLNVIEPNITGRKSYKRVISVNGKEIK
jgi:hypothetical protein